MEDSAGSSVRYLGTLITNCAGNFVVSKTAWNPGFPIIVAIAKPGSPARAMQSHIARERSCSTCHKGKKFIDSAGRVVLSDVSRNAPRLPERCVNGEVNP